MEISRYGRLAMALMITSVVLVIVALFLPWFQYEQHWETDSVPVRTDHYAVFRGYQTVQLGDGVIFQEPYNDSYTRDRHMDNVMDAETGLIVLWVLLGVAFIYSIPKDDAALGIMAGGLVILMGSLGVSYFAIRIMDNAPDLPDSLADGDQVFLLGDGRAWDQTLWSWSVASGWIALLAALVLATVGVVIWMLLEGRD